MKPLWLGLIVVLSVVLNVWLLSILIHRQQMGHDREPPFEEQAGSQPPGPSADRQATQRPAEPAEVTPARPVLPEIPAADSILLPSEIALQFVEPPPRSPHWNLLRPGFSVPSGLGKCGKLLRLHSDDIISVEGELDAFAQRYKELQLEHTKVVSRGDGAPPLLQIAVPRELRQHERDRLIASVAPIIGAAKADMVVSWVVGDLGLQDQGTDVVEVSFEVIDAELRTVVTRDEGRKFLASSSTSLDAVTDGFSLLHLVELAHAAENLPHN